MSKLDMDLQHFSRLASRRQIGRLIAFGPIFSVFLNIFYTSERAGRVAMNLLHVNVYHAMFNFR